MTPAKKPPNTLTASLEDYLETILQLTRKKPVARIKDIARERSVKPGSVSPAMKRLEEMGLISYGRNEYIELTAKGEVQARRVQARHDILTSFFERFLRMDLRDSEIQACEIEHHLSDQAMDRLVRLFEFLNTCPQLPPQFLERFEICCRLNGDEGSCDELCRNAACETETDRNIVTMEDLEPGQTGAVLRVKGKGLIRQRLLDMGILPDAKVKMERKALSGGPVWIRLDTYQLSLRAEEARTVLVIRE